MLRDHAEEERHLRQLVQTVLESEMNMRRQRDRARLDLAAVTVAATAIIQTYDPEFHPLVAQLRDVLARVSS